MSDEKEYTEITEGHLTAMTSASSILLGFSFYFFKGLIRESGAWTWPEGIFLTVCMVGFTLAIFVSLFPSKPKAGRMMFAWCSMLAGFIGFASIAIYCAMD